MTTKKQEETKAHKAEEKASALADKGAQHGLRAELNALWDAINHTRQQIGQPPVEHKAE